MGHDHFVGRVPAPIGYMYGIHAEEIEKRYSEFPAKKKETARKYHHHRKQINHKIDKGIASPVLTVYTEHLTRTPTEITYPVYVEKHQCYRNPLAKPTEESQNPPRIYIAGTHKHRQYLYYVLVSYCRKYALFISFIHNDLVLSILQRYGLLIL